MLLHAVQIRGDFEAEIGAEISENHCLILIEKCLEKFGKIPENQCIFGDFWGRSGPEFFWKNFGKILAILEKFRPKWAQIV